MTAFVVSNDLYRGWHISVDRPAAPVGAVWQGTHPNFNGDDDSRYVTADSYEDLIHGIDQWHAERAEERERGLRFWLKEAVIRVSNDDELRTYDWLVWLQNARAMLGMSPDHGLSTEEERIARSEAHARGEPA